MGTPDQNPSVSNNELKELISALSRGMETKLEEIKTELGAVIPELKALQVSHALLESTVQGHTKEVERSRKREKANNVILFNIPECNNEVDELTHLNSIIGPAVNVVFDELRVNYAFRLGRYVGNKPRPLLVAFTSRLSRDKVMAASDKLRTQNVGVAYDRSLEERQHRKRCLDLVSALKKHGKNVSLSKNEITMNGRATSLEEASAYLEKLSKGKRGRDSDSSGTSTPTPKKTGMKKA
uniref:Uncharacterized protein n=1 Tax=Lygus hesperus TaxID=30085 RepID=A0A0A9WU49_LYGHE